MGEQSDPSVCPPVVSDAVEEAVSMVNHWCYDTQDCGVAHQAGRQHKVTPATTTDRQETNPVCHPSYLYLTLLKINQGWTPVTQKYRRIRARRAFYTVPLCIEGI